MMFGEKCPRCEKRVYKKYDFCPYCGINLTAQTNLDSGDLGFLGKGDFDMKLPFGFNAFMKPLMRELSKQMLELDKELKKEQEKTDKDKGKSIGRFSIHIGMPGSKPIKLNMSSGNVGSQMATKEGRVFALPKISDEDFDKAKGFSKKEPSANVRRLSDRIIYEIEMPGVASIDKVNLSVLEEGIEVKAIGDRTVYQKFIDVVLPLKKYELEKDLLTLELGLK